VCVLISLFNCKTKQLSQLN